MRHRRCRITLNSPEGDFVQRVWWCRLVRPSKSIGTICSVCGRGVRVAAKQLLVKVMDGRSRETARHVGTLCRYCATAPFGEIIATLTRDNRALPDVFVGLPRTEKVRLAADTIALCERILAIPSPHPASE
jgi:hypothetical protein